MSLEEDFHQQMLVNYRKCGEEFGYWANYFNREVKKKGGLATAQRMLQPRKSDIIDKGLQTLIDAGRPDLSVEALALTDKFKALFTESELAEAKRRLAGLSTYFERHTVPPEQNYPEDISDETQYAEGASRKVTVNYYERHPEARAECLRKHGVRCAVCDMSFEERYGPIGRGFIHVHHKKPLALRRAEYKLRPSIDLVPVCPNCHAMLHTQSPPLGVDELRAYLEQHGRT